VRLCTEWAPSAKLRSPEEALPSFEQTRWHASKLDASKQLQPTQQAKKALPQSHQAQHPQTPAPQPHHHHTLQQQNHRDDVQDQDQFHGIQQRPPHVQHQGYMQHFTSQQLVQQQQQQQHQQNQQQQQQRQQQQQQQQHQHQLQLQEQQQQQLQQLSRSVSQAPLSVAASVSEGVSLRVQLCGLRIAETEVMSEESALRVVYRLGVEQEVTCLVADLAEAEDEEGVLCSVLSGTGISDGPVWQKPAAQGPFHNTGSSMGHGLHGQGGSNGLHGGGGSGPVPVALHLHLWQGKELLGLATLELPRSVPPGEGQGGVLLLSRDLELRSLTSPAFIGALRVVLHAGERSKLALGKPPMPALPAPLAPQPAKLSAKQRGPSSTARERVQAAQRPREPEARARDETAAGLWLVAAGISAEAVLAAGRHGTGLTVSGLPDAFIGLEELQEGLLLSVEGLSAAQASSCRTRNYLPA
ncbi:unnamed protein product, partial [Polarella glacialis]